jgi:UDP-GlcNAc:undecaprenyl-phosphate/decaprenyl-phosphate GlcNAc-1-phosphate transferase
VELLAVVDLAGLAWSVPTLLDVLLAGCLAAGLAFVLSLAVARIARRLGWLDRPSPRRIHTRPVPRLGGIAIFLAFAITSLLLYRPQSPHERAVFLGLGFASVLVVIVMAVDDIRGLPPLPRLGVQTLAALVVMFPGAQGTLIEVIHNPLVTADHSRTLLVWWVAVPFTWFWVVGMMNTVNWMDGSDGLAGGIVTITAAAMAAISWMLGQPGPALLCGILAGATLGFLPLNWHPARLFMGDSGAMFLGLALAVLANVGGAKLATMLLLMGVPILDTARVIARRIREGRSPLHFDGSHLHHRLLAGGFTQRQIAALFYAVTAAFGGLTIVAAYLEVHVTHWQLQWAKLPGLVLSGSEVPVLAGLALVVLVTAALLTLALRRRAYLKAHRPWALPPSASSSHNRIPVPVR